MLLYECLKVTLAGIAGINDARGLTVGKVAEIGKVASLALVLVGFFVWLGRLGIFSLALWRGFAVCS